MVSVLIYHNVYSTLIPALKCCQVVQQPSHLAAMTTTFSDDTLTLHLVTLRTHPSGNTTAKEYCMVSLVVNDRVN